MEITSGNRVGEGIHESHEDKMKTFIRSTQKKLADWKTKSKRKRFRFQNVQGTIFGTFVMTHEY